MLGFPASADEVSILLSQKTKQGKEHPLVSGPLLGPPLGSRILGVVQPPDPITELFDKETASPSGSPGLGTREAGILCSQTGTPREQDAQFYQTRRDKPYFRTSSAFCVPDCGLALSLGAGTTLPGNPKLQKHGCWFASVSFVQIKEGLAHYK